MKDYKRYFNVNRQNWDRKVALHVASDFYNVENFKKGRSSLQSYELLALKNVKGKRLLHLQCHFGLDTLSWSREGAICTGIDISPVAISKAKQLANQVNLKADFICGNILDTKTLVDGKFDIVFTSYGVINWLPSLIEWGKIVADTLDTNGVFYMVEFHPICWMFDEKDYRTFTHKYSGGDVITEEVAGSYVDKDDKNSFVEHTWNHGVGDVINALAGAGLHIEYCNEHYQTPYPIFPELIKTSAGLYEQKNGCYPLLFEVKATKR